MASLSGNKLSLYSPVARLLREKLKGGELTGFEAPKTIWKSNSTFQAHKLSNFRGMYHRVRNEIGVSAVRFFFYNFLPLILSHF